jgi:putative peptidoglycan lipid II flippase
VSEPPGSAGQQATRALADPTPGHSVRTVVGRAALVIAFASLLGRAIGLARDVVVAHFFGADEATDAFYLAWRVPYLLAMIVSAALTATFVPLFSYRLATGRKDEAWKLSVNIGNIICLVLVVITVALIIVAPWLMALIGFGFKDPSTVSGAVPLFRILMLGFTFEGLTGLLIGMLNSLRRFALAAFAPAIGTAATLVLTIALAKSLGVTALAVGTTVGWTIGLAVLFLGLRDQQIHYRPRIEWRDPTVREVGGMVWPVLLGSAVGAVGNFAAQILGTMLEEGAVTSLNFADKLFQVPLALFVAGISVPIFPLLSEQVAARAPERIKATLDFAWRLMGFILIPVTVGLILLRHPLLGLLWEHGEFSTADTDRTAWAFLFLVLGLHAYAGRDTMTRVFFAHHDTRTPVKISVITVGLSIGLSYLFMQYLGVGGLALGTTVALAFNFSVLAWLLRRKIGAFGLRSIGLSVVRVVSGSAVMGVAVWAVDQALATALAPSPGSYAVRLVVGALVGVGVFLVAARLLRMRELGESADMLRAVFNRPRREGKAA